MVRFIITFVQIVVKGCWESPAIKVALVLLGSVVVIVFVPCCVGSLLLPSGVFGPAWPIGALVIASAFSAITLLVAIYKAIHECVERKSTGPKRN